MYKLCSGRSSVQTKHSFFLTLVSSKTVTQRHLHWRLAGDPDCGSHAWGIETDCWHTYTTIRLHSLASLSVLQWSLYLHDGPCYRKRWPKWAPRVEKWTWSQFPNPSLVCDGQGLGWTEQRSLALTYLHSSRGIPQNSFSRLESISQDTILGCVQAHGGQRRSPAGLPDEFQTKYGEKTREVLPIAHAAL